MSILNKMCMQFFLFTNNQNYTLQNEPSRIPNETPEQEINAVKYNR